MADVIWFLTFCYGFMISVGLHLLSSLLSRWVQMFQTLSSPIVSKVSWYKNHNRFLLSLKNKEILPSLCSRVLGDFLVEKDPDMLKVLSSPLQLKTSLKTWNHRSVLEHQKRVPPICPSGGAALSRMFKSLTERVTTGNQNSNSSSESGYKEFPFFLWIWTQLMCPLQLRFPESSACFCLCFAASLAFLHQPNVMKTSLVDALLKWTNHQ